MTSTAPALEPAVDSPTVAQVDAGAVENFRKQGFLLLPQFLSSAALHALRSDIAAYLAAGDTTQVRWAASHFDTFNGDDVDRHFPLLGRLYDGQVLHTLQHLDASTAQLSQRSVGLSVNITPQGGKFQPHFDRNRLTAVLYANDDYDGGEMLIYPRIRYWLGPVGGWAHRKLQRLLDRYVRRQSYLDAYARQVAIKPRAGDLLIFEGNRTYHAVQPVHRGGPRISIQFAYDHAGAVFDISAYYGKTKT